MQISRLRNYCRKIVKTKKLCRVPKNPKKTIRKQIINVNEKIINANAKLIQLCFHYKLLEHFV